MDLQHLILQVWSNKAKNYIRIQTIKNNVKEFISDIKDTYQDHGYLKVFYFINQIPSELMNKLKLYFELFYNATELAPGIFETHTNHPKGTDIEHTLHNIIDQSYNGDIINYCLKLSDEDVKKYIYINSHQSSTGERTLNEIIEGNYNYSNILCRGTNLADTVLIDQFDTILSIKDGYELDPDDQNKYPFIISPFVLASLIKSLLPLYKSYITPIAKYSLKCFESSDNVLIDECHIRSRSLNLTVAPYDLIYILKTLGCINDNGFIDSLITKSSSTSDVGLWDPYEHKFFNMNTPYDDNVLTTVKLSDDLDGLTDYFDNLLIPQENNKAVLSTKKDDTITETQLIYYKNIITNEDKLTVYKGNNLAELSILHSIHVPSDVKPDDVKNVFNNIIDYIDFQMQNINIGARRFAIPSLLKVMLSQHYIIDDSCPTITSETQSKCNCNICSLPKLNITDITQHQLIQHFVSTLELKSASEWSISSEILAMIEVFITDCKESTKLSFVINKNQISQSLSEFLTKKRKVMGMTFNCRMPSITEISNLTDSTNAIIKSKLNIYTQANEFCNTLKKE